ncbi:MAG: molybdopterin-dependent oxidoreductase, partial [Pseudomonadota bacterium]
LKGGLKIGVIGEKADLTYDYEFVGAGPSSLQDVAGGQHAFADVLKSAERPLVIVGPGAVTRPDGAAVLALAAKVAQSTGKPHTFNVIHTAASRVAALDLGFTPGDKGLDTAAILDGASADTIDVLYLLGADEMAFDGLKDTFVIYQGSHGDAGAHRADVILPAAAYTEKQVTYVNLEGRAQMTNRAVFPPGDAKEDWAIIRALSPLVGHTLPFDSLSELQSQMYKQAPALQELDSISATDDEGVAALAVKPVALDSAPFSSPVRDFFTTNPIARASSIMAELSALKAASLRGETLTAAE